MNLILPKREFLDALRKLCTKHGVVLILDPAELLQLAVQEAV